ncbi:MAG: hypothetical protein GXX85_14470 [Ignavibacteria bacterium]|nr:hypothetical protein [Ignavibacteria bacterium]
MFRRHSLVGEIHTATHGFMTEWTVSGDAEGRTITLPLVAGYNYDCVIDWGDGSAKNVVTAFDDVNRIHTYSVAGKYKVEITGTCEGWSFNNAGDKLKITNILYWGNPLKFNDFKDLTGGFYGCTALKSLGRGSILYSGSGGFYETFRNCISVTSVPVDLFKYSTAVSENGFRRTFYGCSSLASLPVDLFRYNTLVSTNGFRETFYGCSLLASLPVDLFRYNTAVSTYGFYATFYGCSSLASLPVDLFRYNTAVSIYGFYATFRGCRKLASLPVDLFRYNTAVSTYGFYATFHGCSSLASLPDGLFRYNTAVSTDGFYRTFYGCVKLQLHKWIFYLTGEEGTRFLNKTLSFAECFFLTSFAGTIGEAPELWNCNFGTGTPTITDCFNGHSINSVSNYADIPAEWL